MREDHVDLRRQSEEQNDGTRRELAKKQREEQVLAGGANHGATPVCDVLIGSKVVSSHVKRFF
jgi:hypothetical protein